MEAERPPEEPRRRGRRRKAMLPVLFVMGVVVGGAAATIVTSRPGQRMVLDALLGRIQGGLAGPLTVQDIRSRSLLGGATLIGVRLDAEGGRRFLEADSASVRYSVLSLVGASPRLAGLTLWGPRVEISRMPDEEAANVTRLVRRDAAPDSATRRAPIVLGRVRIEGGTLEVLTPTASAGVGRVPTVPVPGGEGRLRRLGFDDLSLEVEGARLFDEGGAWFVGDLNELAVDIGILDEALRVVDADGAVGFGPQGLTIEDATFRFPGSTMTGDLALGPREVGPPGWAFRVDLRTDGPAALEDLRWLDRKIPSGSFRGAIGVGVDRGVVVDLGSVAVNLEASSLTVDGGVRIAAGVTLRDLEVDASPVALSRLEPWLGADIPAEGWLSGGVRLSGTLGALQAEGMVTLVPTGYGGRPTSADFRGTLHAGANPGVTDFEGTLDPVNFEVLGALQPAIQIRGDGRVQLTASGRIDDGVRFSADVVHGSGLPGSTRILAQGSTRRIPDQGWVSDIQGDLAPLALEPLGSLAPALSLGGALEGSVRAVGPWSALQLTGDLTAGGGALSLDATIDIRDIARGYRLDAEASQVRLSELFRALPDRSTWSGSLTVEGAGLHPDSLEGRGSLTATASRLGGLHVNHLGAGVSVSGGVLEIDTLSADLGDVYLSGSGTFGLREDAIGSARVDFDTESLLGLRSIFRGDTVMARDDLTELERAFLPGQGIDPDTLPLLADVAMDGAMEGSLEFTGSLSELNAEGGLRLRRGVYGRDAVDRAAIWLVASDVTSPDRSATLDVEAEGIQYRGRAFAAISAEVALEGQRTDGAITLVRSEEERYELNGAVTFEADGGEVELREADLGLRGARWHLSRPTRMRWGPDLLAVEDLELTREDEDPMLVTAGGVLSWNGASDFQMDAAGLHLDRLARVTQWAGPEMAGHLDLGLRVTGPARSPLIDAFVDVEGGRYGHISLGRVSGRIEYRDRLATVDLEARDDGRQVFRAEGTVPVDLALDPEGSRIVNESMDVSVVADELEATAVLSYLTFLEDQEGSISGDFRITGPLDAPEPSGVLNLTGGAWSLAALGVRHTGVEGVLTLRPDRTVGVDMQGSAGGTAIVGGTIHLEPLTNPSLDLTIAFSRFQAVSRRDVEGSISGEVQLLQRYRQPFVQGSLSVDRGTLFLEEFARSAEIVDLSDPALLDDRFFEVVDTTAASHRPLLSGMNNPFLQTLRVGVNLSVPRDAWLRSQDMNVEIGGDLLVTYDRTSRDLVMVGELQALRGTYTVLGRRFQVEEGVVGFIGTPGINPTLALQAVSRIRRREGDPLDVTATVSGNLTQPRVALSSPEQGVAESDLVSYLIFGRPSYELATGQGFGNLQGSAGSLAGAATGFGVTWLSGTLANQLSSAFAQQIGVDYLSINQTSDLDVITGRVSGSILAGTQVEVGQYLGEDVFFVLIFQPVARPGDTGVERFFGGARVEVALSDDYSVQGFWEDRFLRSGVGGFGGVINPEDVLGVFIFREWGY